MKLGVGYIAFTGAEFLKPSLQNIRPFADHIVVVYSNISHTGDSAPKYLEPLVKGLEEEGLIDELICLDMTPTFVGDSDLMMRTANDLVKVRGLEFKHKHPLSTPFDERDKIYQIAHGFLQQDRDTFKSMYDSINLEEIGKNCKKVTI